MTNLLEKMTLKGALAFVLVFLSFILVFTWMKAPPNTADGNMIALLAGFVTLFLTMTKDAVGYNFTSSASQERQQQTTSDQASRAIDALAASAPVAATAAPAPVVVVAWWSLLTEPERQAIHSAAPNDPKCAAFMAAAQTGKAAPADLDYLVAGGLLTAERAKAIVAS